jgi:drug/metabolite transporter (DMT)-like permease
VSVPGPAPRTPENVRRGIFILVATMFVFAFQDGITKQLSQQFAGPQIILARFAAFVLLGLWLLRRNGLHRAFHCHRPWLQLLRGGVLVVQMLGFVLTVRLLPLADTHVILSSTPLIVTVLAVPLLGERVDLRRWMAVLAGFIGVLIILRPGTGVMQVGSGIALIVALLYALFIILTSKVSRVDAPGTTLLWTGTVGLLSMGIAAPFVWMWPDLEGWLMLGALMVLGSTSHLLLIRALECAPASVLQPYSYTVLVWATVVGWVGFGDLPDVTTIIGAVVIVASGIDTYRQARKGRVD